MQVQEIIARLCSDRRRVIVPPDIPRPKGLDFIVIKDLTGEDRNYYSFIKDLERDRAVRDGVSTEEEIMQHARKAGYWSQADDDVIERAEELIASLKEEKERYVKFKSRQNIIDWQIKDAEAKLAHSQTKLGVLKSNSAEYLAHEIACLHLVRRTAMGPNESNLFSSEEEVVEMKARHPEFVFFLVKEIMTEGVIEATDLRKVARSNEWRLTWSLSRENLPVVFNRQISDFCINHKVLIYWSRLYDLAFESHEPPDASIIEDDELFDEWLKSRDNESTKSKMRDAAAGHQERGAVLDGYYSEECTCGAKEQNRDKKLGEKVQHALDCPWGTWVEYTSQQKEKQSQLVYGRNSKGIRHIINKTQERVDEVGLAEEQNLYDKKTRSVLGMPTKVVGKNK